MPDAALQSSDVAGQLWNLAISQDNQRNATILINLRGVVQKIRSKGCISWWKCSKCEDLWTCTYLVGDANPRAEIRSGLRRVRQKMPGRHTTSSKQEMRTLVQKSASIPSVSKRNSLLCIHFLPQNTKFWRYFPPWNLRHKIYGLTKNRSGVRQK